MESLARALTALLGTDRAIFAPDALRAWECDGFTIHKQPPLGVVLPETTEETQTIVRQLVEADVAFIPRGAGTCLSGGPTPTGPAVLIEMARMKGVLKIDVENQLAVVQPGVVNAALSRHVAHLDMHYAPDPSSQMVCTIGGNLAENSGGPHCFKYGMTTDHVLGATIVLPDGTVAQFGGADGPRAPHELDWVGVFTGSEGTFGIATEIVVRLSRNQPGVRTLLASFDSMPAACGAVSEIVARGMVPAALEILDAATIAAVEASVFRAGYPTDATAVLLVELDGPPEQLEADATEVQQILATGAIAVEEAHKPEDRARLWQGRKGAFGAMGRLNTDLYVLDGVVPRTRLVETLDGIAAIGKKFDLKLTNVFHAGDGNLHPNISFDGRDAEQVHRVEAAGREILTLCMDMGGSITGEHGIGTEKLEHVPLMFDEADLEVMDRVRRVFDPDNRCNPGKVLPERRSCAEVAKWPKMVEAVLRPNVDPTANSKSKSTP